MKTPRKVRGLLDFVEAEASGEEWELDKQDPLVGIGLGLGHSSQAKRLALLGLLSVRLAEIDQKLSDLKPKKGAPAKAFSIDVERAEAVLQADDLIRDKFDAAGAATQKEAIEVAVQIDRILVETGSREKPLFGKMTSIQRLQTSVSNGLRTLGVEADRFTKK